MTVEASLSALASSADALRRVSFDAGDGPVTGEKFLRDVIDVRRKIAEHGGKRWAIFVDVDYYAFAVGLVSLFSLGTRIYLPSGVEPETMDRLARQVDGCFGDFPLAAVTTSDVDRIGEPVQDVSLPAAVPGAAIVIFTSGSSGDSKEIEKSPRQIDAELNVLEATWSDVASGTTFISSVSQQHIYGLLFTILWPLCTGRTIHRKRLADAAAVQQLVASSDESARYVWVSSPAHLRRMSPGIDWSIMRSRVVEIFSSGSALPDAAVAELTQKFGRSAVEVYGSSETGGIAIRRQQPGYTAPWQPFNVVGCRLADDGRLEISSPYLPSADWYRTDDLVKFDGQGRFHLLGRSDQLVKVEGKRVSLQKVQSALVGLEDVQDAKVVLLTSASRDLLGAVVVLARSGLDYLFAHGKGSLINRLRRELTTGLDALSIPRKWRFVEQIPMNAQGKFVAEYVQSLFHDASSVKRPEVLGAYVEDAERCFVLGVPDNLLYFHGHFDAAAILPGVVQVDWAMWLATSAFDIEGEFQSMEAVKFHRLVRPGDVVRLELARAGNKLRFKYSTHEALVSSGRIVFTESLP